MVWFLRLLLFRRPYMACLLKLRLVLPTWSVAYDPPSIFLFIYGMLVTLPVLPHLHGEWFLTLSPFSHPYMAWFLRLLSFHHPYMACLLKLCLALPTWSMAYDTPTVFSSIYGMLATLPVLPRPHEEWFLKHSLFFFAHI